MSDPFPATYTLIVLQLTTLCSGPKCPMVDHMTAEKGLLWPAFAISKQGSHTRCTYIEAITITTKQNIRTYKAQHTTLSGTIRGV
jgi:hypothetical protein